MPPSEKGWLAQSVAEMVGEHPDLTGIAPLRDGAEAFAARMLLADSAAASIDAEYYIWRADLTGYLLLDQLKKAADRGVGCAFCWTTMEWRGLTPRSPSCRRTRTPRLWNLFTLRSFKMMGYTLISSASIAACTRALP
ncbi:hypothetical protein MASR2M17_03580 [Aminivibrio sp.]